MILCLDFLLISILVILNDYTYVYTFDQLKLYAKYPTFSNPKGIGALQINNGEPMILTLGKAKGTIRVSVRRILLIIIFSMVKEKKDYSVLMKVLLVVFVYQEIVN